MFIKLTNHNGTKELISIDNIIRVLSCEGNNGEKSRIILLTGPNLHYMESVEEIDELLEG